MRHSMEVRWRLLAMLLAPALLSAFDDGPAASSKERSLLLERTRIVIQGLAGTRNELGLVVFSGKGKKLLVLGGIDGGLESGGIIKKAYFEADMHPSHQRFVAVRCLDFPKNTDIYRTAPQTSPIRCDLMLYDLGTLVEESLYAPPEGAWVHSPRWSPKGDRLAFFEGRDIVVWTRNDLVRLPDAIAHEVTPYSWDVNLGWNSSGDRLFVYAEVPGARTNQTDWTGREDLGEVNVQTRKVDWLGLRDFYFMYGKYYGAGAILVENKGWLSRPKQMPDIPATRALFGSAENAVFRPMWAPDRSFYSYETKREGWFASTWLEAYEPAFGRVFRIRTLDRALYAE